jgi:hypothetical protein
MLSSHVTGWLQLQLDTDSVQSWYDANLMNPNRSKTRVSLLCLWIINVMLCTSHLLVLTQYYIVALFVVQVHLLHGTQLLL